MTHKPSADSLSQLVVFETSGTVAFTGAHDTASNPAYASKTHTIREVWSWYETALDIAALPTLDPLLDL
jgi:hypothetical protein